MTIRVLLADDHQMVREGLRTLLEQQNGIQVVGEATDGWTAVQQAKELNPDIVVMDVSMPGLNGIEATRQIATEAPDSRVVALSVHSDKRFVVEMLKMGAKGYLLKTSAFDELVQAITAVARGQVYLSPHITGYIVDGYLEQSTGEGIAAFTQLTAREREVIQLLAEGITTREIASLLFISQKTVDVHRQNIMEKLDLHSIADLVRYAIKEGIVSLES
ncbi:MAG: response regulator [Armatimonadota bacterium]